MTFDELKKIIEVEFADIEEELAGLPAPKVGDNDLNPQYLLEYAMKKGTTQGLAWVLGKLPHTAQKPKGRSSYGYNSD